jgi:hypothetical protein
MPAIQKDSVNPHFGNRYVSLQNLMGILLPILNANAIVLTQYPTSIDGKPALYTLLTHVPSGEQTGESMLLSPDKTGPQAQGSAITYARRYALMSILGLVADEDDDGEASVDQTQRADAEQATW